MATHSVICLEKSHGQRPWGLQSIGSQKLDMAKSLCTHTQTQKQRRQKTQLLKSDRNFSSHVKVCKRLVIQAGRVSNWQDQQKPSFSIISFQRMFSLSIKSKLGHSCTMFQSERGKAASRKSDTFFCF